MKKNLLVYKYVVGFIIVLLTFSCKNYLHVDYNKSCSHKLKTYQLNKFNEVNKINNIKTEGVILFMTSFNNEQYLVINGKDTIFNGKLLTDKSLGFAKSVKYNRNSSIIISTNNTKKELIINSKKIKYPYLYIFKDNRTNEFVVQNTSFICFVK